MIDNQVDRDQVSGLAAKRLQRWRQKRMQDLEITWPDGEARFSVTDSPVHLGRSSEAAIPLTEGSVSRRHLELIWNGTTWIANDSSTHGTYDPIGVRLAREWSLSTDTTIRLGGIEGVQVQIALVPNEEQGGNGASAGGLFGPPDEDRDQKRRLPPSGSLFPEREQSPAAKSILAEDDRRPARPDVPAPEPVRAKSTTPAPAHQSPAPPRTTAPPEPVRAESPPPPVADRPDAPTKSAPDTAPPGPSQPGTAQPEAGALRHSTVLGTEDGTAAADVGAPSGALGQSNSQPGAFSGLDPTGGQPAISVDPHSTLISDATLRLNVGGQDYSFLPGAEVTVGRDPSCLVQLDERHSLVSRKHLRITFDDGFWWLEDFSSKGTFINNRQLKKPYRAEGAFIANLGDDDAGTPMRVITAGEHRTPRNRNMWAIAGLAAAALIPLLILAILLTRGGSTSDEPDLATAKRSTVMLLEVDGGRGSGFLVSDDLILTNQHIAVLSPQLLVGVSRQADEPAQIEYATELVANHPFLDLAVLRISNRVTMTSAGAEISSEPVGDIGLPAVTIGDSADVTIGDRVFNTGFPGRLSITSTDDAGDLRLPAVVATSGEAANFAIWPGCSNPDFELFIPADSPPGVACSAGGDLRNGVMLSSFFSSGQGASGSAIFHDDQVVSVVYAGAADEDNANLSITTQVFGDWLQEIIDQNS